MLARGSGSGSGSGVRRVAARSPGGCSSPAGPWGCAATAARPAAATAAAAAAASAAGARCGVRCEPRSCRRAGRVAQRLRAHSLTSIPLASRRPLSSGSPGLAGPGRETQGWRGCVRVGAAEGKSKGGRRRGRAHTPLPWHRPPLCGRALPPGAAARSCRGVGDGAGFFGVQTLAAGRSQGEKFISPSEA